MKTVSMLTVHGNLLIMTLNNCKPDLIITVIASPLLLLGPESAKKVWMNRSSKRRLVLPDPTKIRWKNKAVPLTISPF